jgi:O-antigen/teichoic acid export membrane protein
MSQVRAGAVLSYVQLALGNVSALLLTPLLLRSLGQSGYGVYALVGTLVGYISILDLGLGSTIVRYVAKYRAEGDRDAEARFMTLCLLFYAGLGAVVVGAGAVLHAQLGPLFGDRLSAAELADARTMFVLMVGNLAVSFPLGAYSALITGHERFVLARGFAIGRIVVRFALAAGLLRAGYGAVAIVVLDTVLNLASGAFGAWYAHAALHFRFRAPRPDGRFVREVVAFTGFVFLNMIVDQVYWRIGHTILAASAGPASVAVFAVAMTFVQYYMQFSMGISGVLLPKVTRMVTGGASASEITALFSRTGRVQLVVLAYVLAGFTLFGRAFIRLWAGVEYEAAWLPAVVLMVPLTIPLIQNVGISVLQARNQQAFRVISYAVVAVANVAVTVVAVRRWGVAGAALATAASLVVGNVVVMNLYYRRRIGLDVGRFFRETLGLLGPAAALSLAAGWPLAFWGAATWAGLAVRIAAFTAVYALAMWRLGLTEDERRELRGAAARAGGYRWAA